MDKEKDSKKERKLFSIRKLFSRNYIIIGGVIVLLLFIGLSIPLIFRGNDISKIPSSSNELPKLWRMIFSYNARTDQLSLKSMAIKNGIVHKSPFSFSPYKLMIYDKHKQLLYEDYIQIAQSVVYQYYGGETSTGAAKLPPQEETLDSIVVVPYFPTADHVEVTRDGGVILKFTPLKKSSINIVPQVYADAACSPLHVVFLQDSYASLSQYHQDVETIKNYLKTVDPYSTAPQIFDFKTIDNTESFGCKQGGYFNAECLIPISQREAVLNIVLSKYPDIPQNPEYLKMIVLTDAQMNGPGVAGLTFGLGSAFGLFQTTTELRNVSIHEIGGHAIGYLYDRYVIDQYNPNIGSPANTGVKSNCTDNSNGESFWSTARTRNPNAYPGCIFNNFYSPGPRTCPNPNDGTPESIMSAATACARGTGFDEVERYWIQNEIIPQYLSCPASPTSTPTTTVATSTPTPTTPIGINTVNGGVYIDANSNRTWEAGEMGVSGVELTIASSTDPRTTITNTQGRFVLENMVGDYQLEQVTINGQDFSVGLAFTVPPITRVEVPLTPDFIPFLTPQPSRTPTPTRPSSTSTPTVTVVSTPPGGGSSGGGSDSVPDEEAIQFYRCYEVQDTRVVNGAPIRVSRLQCDPE